jgi:hypothetical protein
MLTSLDAEIVELNARTSSGPTSGVRISLRIPVSELVPPGAAGEAFRRRRGVSETSKGAVVPLQRGSPG